MSFGRYTRMKIVGTGHRLHTQTHSLLIDSLGGTMLRALFVCLIAIGFLQPTALKATESLIKEIRRGQDTPVTLMAEWEVLQTGRGEQTGARILIAAGEEELSRAPANAVRYESRTFGFPSGEIRVLDFSKENGGVLHQITTETQLYVVKGSASVGIAGEQVELSAGDVAHMPSGVLRSIPGKIEDTTVVAYTIPSPTTPAVVVRGRDNPITVIGSGAKAGEAGAKVSVQRYAYEGNSIRIARLEGPGKNSPSTPRLDALIYLISGRMNLHLGDEIFEVKAGDALREPAGIPVFWDILEPSSFIATNGANP